MKRIILTLSVALVVAFIFTSCSNGNKNESVTSVRPDITKVVSLTDTASLRFQKEEEMRKENQAISKLKEIPVGEDNFSKLVTFIEKRGFVVPQGGVPSDYQFTFFDSKGNRHAMITTRRDTEGKPSTKGTVSQISVWAYKKGIKDQKHFFGYCISPNTMHPYYLELDGTWKGVDEATFGYNEFLKKVCR